MANTYYQICYSFKGEDTFTAEWSHNYDSFHEAAETFREEIKRNTGEDIEPPAKIDDAYFGNDNYDIWIWKVPKFPFLIP